MCVSIHEHAYVISVLYCRTLSDGVGAEETDGVTVVELEGGGGDEGELAHTFPERPENGEKDTTVARSPGKVQGRTDPSNHK